MTYLRRWRRWWCSVVMDGVRHSARNCAYLTFQHKGAKYLLHIPLYPTTAITSRSQAYATSSPKSQTMEYFKSTHHVRVVYLYRSAISANLLLHWKYTSKSMVIQTMRTKIKFKIHRTCTQTKCPLTPHAAPSSKVLYWQLIQVTSFNNTK
jgi:hypothetical protein